MSAEKRRELRIEQHDTLHVQLARGDEVDTGLLLQANTENVSRSGLRARTNYAVTNGRIFDLLLHLPSHAAPFLLTVEVRWCHRVTLEHFDVGFAILPAAHSDFQSWQHIFDTNTQLTHNE
jgi:hypothetical protein